MAIDSELEDEQKARRKLEVHQLCERFKWASFQFIRRRGSELCETNCRVAATLPTSCEDQPILQEIEALEAFEQKNVLAKFWGSMFARSYPTSWWRQFATLLSRSAKVAARAAPHS